MILYWSCEEVVEDTTLPTVTITTAFSGSVYEIVAISVMVNDDSGIDKVELWVDGVNTNITDDAEPYELNWNTSSYEDSSAHVIVVRVYDTSGNTADSQPITLTVDNTASAPEGGNITLVTYTLTEMVVVWEQSEDGDLKNYKVLYSQTESGDKDTIATYTDKTTTSHTMAEFDPTHENWFWVQLTDTLGFSRVGAGMTNEIDSPPNQSEFYGVVYENDSFIITWSQNIDADFQSYSLYESFSEDMSGATLMNEMDLVTDTTYTVIGIIGGETRYYQVVTKDVFGLETESESIMGATYLFQANFTNDWLCDDCGEGIIFLSEMDGTFITMATWSGNASFDIPVPEGLSSVPDKFSVTTITGTETYASLYTNLNIPIGSTWTWGKEYPDEPDWESDPGVVDMYFSNVPEHSGYALSGAWYSNSSSNGTINDSYNISNREPSNYYIMLKTLYNGVRYSFLENVAAGEITVDLSNLDLTDSTSINLNGNSIGYRTYLYGFPNPGNRYAGNYRLERGVGDSLTYNSVNVYQPQNMFTDYRTSLYFLEEGGSSDYWYQSVYGEIPTNFTKLDADYEYVSISPTDFELSTTSTNFDQIRTIWTYSDSYWYVYGPSDLNAYVLPVIPDEVRERYSFLETELFTHSQADLYDHSELNSYYEILELVFESSNLFYDVVNDFRARHKVYQQQNLQHIQNDGSKSKNPYEAELFPGDQMYLQYKNIRDRTIK